MKFSCYVAAPYLSAAFVRVVHESLVSHGIAPTSTWAEQAVGVEDFSRYSPEALRGVAAQNDADLRASDVVFLLDLDGSGRETYAEGRIALEWGKPVVWLSRRGLSQWRDGVVRVDAVEDGISTLVAMRDAFARGYRGRMLAALVSEVA